MQKYDDDNDDDDAHDDADDDDDGKLRQKLRQSGNISTRNQDRLHAPSDRSFKAWPKKKVKAKWKQTRRVLAVH